MEFYNGTIENPFRPFSNGTSAMMWFDENCDRCKKAWHPKEGNWPKEATLKNYVRMGKYCKLQYWMHIAWIESTIPHEIAQQIGLESNGCLKSQCMFFSDNDDDSFRHPKRPRPDNTPSSQLVMPFILDEITKTVRINPVLELERT